MSFLKNFFKSKKNLEPLKIDEIKEIENGELIEEKNKCDLANDSTEIIISEKTINDYIHYYAEEEVKKDLKYELENFDFYNQYFVEKWIFSNLDPLCLDAAVLIVQSQMGYTSLIQRKLKIGYNQAGRIMDILEEIGIVGPANGHRAREVLIKDTASLAHILIGIELIPDDKKDELRVKYAERIIMLKFEIKKSFYLEKKQYEESIILREKEAIRIELLEKERLRNIKKQVRKELLENGEIITDRKREPIPQDVQDKVWIRDGGECVVCGSRENLEFDHVIPFSKGGANTYRNLQLLCENCNRKKSNNIG